MTQAVEGFPAEAEADPPLEQVVALATPLADPSNMLGALSLAARGDEPARAFLVRAAELIAGMLGARRCAFWRLRGENLLAVEAHPYGCTVAERRSLHAVFAAEGTTDTAGRIVRRGLTMAGDTDAATPGDGYLAVIRSVGVLQHVSTPWQWGEKCRGVLAVYDTLDGMQFPADAQTLLEAAAFATALIVELKESRQLQSTLAAEEGRRTHEVALLQSVAGALTSIEDVTDIFAEAARVAAQIVSPAGVPPRRAAFLLLQDDHTLVSMAEYDETGERLRASYPLADFPSLEHVVSTGEVAVDDYGDLSRHSPQVADVAVQHHLQSRAVVPVRSGGAVVGVLTVAARDEVGFDDEQLQRVMAIANIVGLAMGNTALARSLRREAEHSQELERLKGEFLNVAAHELRSPLGIVKGYVSMLLDGTVPEAQVPRVLGLLDLKADEMGRLITEMLETARMETVGLELAMEQVDLLDVIDGALRTTAPLIDGRRRVVVEGDRVPILVMGDRSRLITALTNLIDNAIKYSPDGGDVELSWSAVEGAAQVQVRDCGIGISGEQLPVLFTRFGRIVTPETSHIRGTGLGLFLSRETVLRHGGDITLTSEAGSGSTFTITLPLAVPLPL